MHRGDPLSGMLGGKDKPSKPKSEEEKAKEAKEKDRAFTLNSRYIESYPSTWPHFERVDAPDEDEAESTLTCSPAEKGKILAPGIYRRQPDLDPPCNLRLHEDGRVTPTLFAWLEKDKGTFKKYVTKEEMDREKRQAYGAVYDFLAGTQGSTTIIIDFPKNYKNLDQKGLIEMIEMQFEIARDKHLSVEFGPRIEEFLDTIDVLDRQRLNDIREKLLLNETINREIIYKSERSERFDHIRKKLEDNVAISADARKAEVLKDTDDDKKLQARLDAIGKELGAEGKKAKGGAKDRDKSLDQPATGLFKRLEEFDRANKKMETTLRTYNKMLTDPTCLEYVGDIEQMKKTPGYLTRLANGLGLSKAEEKQLSDPNELMRRIVELNEKNQDKRDKLLVALKKEVDETQKHFKVWEAEVADLMTKLDGKRAVVPPGSPPGTKGKLTADEEKQYKALGELSDKISKVLVPDVTGKNEFDKRKEKLAEIEKQHNKLNSHLEAQAKKLPAKKI